MPHQRSNPSSCSAAGQPDEYPGDETGHQSEDAAAQRRRARRRARMDAVFGSVLPETTSDERHRGTSGRTGADYARERPPHHDG